MGVQAYNALENEMFVLRAFSPYEVGDMPAVSQAWLRSKSSNSKRPCRFCWIWAIPFKGKGNTTHYCPIHRPPEFPPSDLDPSDLPLRSDGQWRKQAHRVDRALTQKEQKRQSMKYGILGTTILAKPPGIHFTYSFPFDLMHLLINTFGNYTTFIGSPTYKDFGAGTKSYIINKKIWKEIGATTKQASATIPAQFGKAVPNIAEERFYFTAETYLVWYTLYAPILLRGRFLRDRYYDHLMRFVSIVNRLLQFKSTKAERDQLRQDIVTWYNEYEK